MLSIVYTASLDTAAKVITTLVIVAFIGLGYWSFRSIRKAKGDKISIALHSFVIITLLTVICVSFWYSPRKYTVGNFDIAINRMAGDVVIHVKDITEIRGVNPGEMDGLSRTFGVGGLFGYFGKYYNGHNGDMEWYATRNDNLVVIHTVQGQTIVISPDDKDFAGRVLAKKQDL